MPEHISCSEPCGHGVRHRQSCQTKTRRWIGGVAAAAAYFWGGLLTALVATGFAYDPARRQSQAEVLAGVIPEIRDIRRAGSAALDLCWVAAAGVPPLPCCRCRAVAAAGVPVPCWGGVPGCWAGVPCRRAGLRLHCSFHSAKGLAR